jgi:hypothetical protein
MLCSCGKQHTPTLSLGVVLLGGLNVPLAQLVLNGSENDNGNILQLLEGVGENWQCPREKVKHTVKLYNTIALGIAQISEQRLNLSRS